MHSDSDAESISICFDVNKPLVSIVCMRESVCCDKFSLPLLCMCTSVNWRRSDGCDTAGEWEAVTCDRGLCLRLRRFTVNVCSSERASLCLTVMRLVQFQLKQEDVGELQAGSCNINI